MVWDGLDLCLESGLVYWRKATGVEVGYRIDIIIVLCKNNNRIDMIIIIIAEIWEIP